MEDKKWIVVQYRLSNDLIISSVVEVFDNNEEADSALKNRQKHLEKIRKDYLNLYDKPKTGKTLEYFNSIEKQLSAPIKQEWIIPDDVGVVDVWAVRT